MRAFPARFAGSRSKRRTTLSPVRNAAHPITGIAGSRSDTAITRRLTVLRSSGPVRNRSRLRYLSRNSRPLQALPSRARRRAESAVPIAAIRTHSTPNSAPAAAGICPAVIGAPLLRLVPEPIPRLLIRLLPMHRRAAMGNTPPFICRSTTCMGVWARMSLLKG